jgi:hypothetical protein
MKKLLLVSLLTFGSSLFAGPDIGISIQTPIENGGMLGLNFRSDDHRYDHRYRHFDYDRYGYPDDFGYYYGYFDRTGYFYNNIFFLYDGRYTYYDRLHRRGHFDSHRPHYREYRHHKNNDWNRSRNYRNDREPVYGYYYERNNNQRGDYRQKENHQQRDDRNYQQQNDYRNHKEHKENRNSHGRDEYNHR